MADRLSWVPFLDRTLRAMDGVSDLSPEDAVKVLSAARDSIEKSIQQADRSGIGVGFWLKQARLAIEIGKQAPDPRG